MKGNLEPVAAFVSLARQAAIDFRETEGVMWGLTNLLLGMDPNTQSIRIWMLGVPGEELRNTLHINPGANPYYVDQDWLPYGMKGKSPVSNQGDWNPEYFDSTSNQAFHFWYYVAMQYYATTDIERGLPTAINNLHDPYQLEDCFGPDLSNLAKIPVSGKIFEWISENITNDTSRQDSNLSINGMALGSELRSSENSDPFSIPNWIYSNLKNLYYERSTWGKEGEE
ncbi:MAG: hypothetical protein GXY37_03540 [Chloroflexi bacterium]|nr:hypothetical protein [Chloroflexota bacterium]